MTDKAKASRAAYYREWRQKNKDKVTQYHVNYWEKRAASEDDSEDSSPEKIAPPLRRGETINLKNL